MKPINFYFGRKREEEKEESGEGDSQGSTEVAHASTVANGNDANFNMAASNDWTAENNIGEATVTPAVTSTSSVSSLSC